MFASLQSLRDRAAARFSSADRGATAVEYGLLVGLIAVVIIGAVVLLGTQLGEAFTGITEALTGAGIGGGAEAPAAP